MTSKLWEPSPERIAQANVTAFARRVAARHGVDVADYATLWRWSIDHKEEFWRELWDFGGVIGTPGDARARRRRPHARRALVPRCDAQLRAEPARAQPADDDGDALVFWGEDKVAAAAVARRAARARRRAFARRCSAHGIAAGDRVAAYMPNMPETIIAMLGTASRRAPSGRRARRTSACRAWSIASARSSRRCWSPSTATGTTARPIADPRQGRRDRRATCRRSRRSSSCRISQQRRHSRRPRGVRDAVAWDALLAPHAAGPIDYVRLPFDHPLYILYSSGTTGVPKCIVHGAGGTLLQHLKEHLLHGDVEARRSPVLLHDLRLDDVELARVRARRAARRCCSTTARRSSTAAACCGTSRTPSG